MRATLLELAEEPGLWMPLAPPSEVIERDGYALVTSLRSASVERVRLKSHDVRRAVDETRAFGLGQGYEHVTWWLGELSQPSDVSERLLELGLAPDADEAEMTTLTLDRPPGGEPAVEVRRAESADEYLDVLELDWEVWEVPEDRRAAYRPIQRNAWPIISATGRIHHYLALVDGKPAGAARGVYTERGGILLGGSTLPWARGRGVYTSLVHARWRETVERGVPRLTVGAGRMSTPILERLGFEPIGKILLLRDTM